MNRNEQNMNDDMLVKYLLEEASETEREDVRQWIAASAANKKYFEHFQLIWDQSKLLAVQSTVNENDAWQRFVDKAKDAEATEHMTVPSGRTIPLFQRAWIRAAAVLLLFAGIGSIVYNMAGRVEQRVVNSGNAILSETLPDGSVVVLNRNSSIAYASRFEGNTRNVKLTGEAFFTVTHDKTKPFIIDANNAAVTVVGTSFNVKTTDARTEVIVETGIVQVAKKEKSVRVKPNQRAIVETGKEAPQLDTTTDELYSYYRTKEFKCNSTSLRKFVAVLNDAYDVHITFADDKLGDLLQSGTFKNEALDGILNVICETHNMKMERSGGDILLKSVNR